MTRLFAAFDVHLEDGGGEVALDDLLPQIGEFERYGLRRLAVTVNDARYFSFTTSLACGPLAGTWARRGFQLGELLSHGRVSKK